MARGRGRRRGDGEALAVLASGPAGSGLCRARWADGGRGVGGWGQRLAPADKDEWAESWPPRLGPAVQGGGPPGRRAGLQNEPQRAGSRPNRAQDRQYMQQWRRLTTAAPAWRALQICRAPLQPRLTPTPAHPSPFFPPVAPRRLARKPLTPIKPAFFFPFFFCLLHDHAIKTPRLPASTALPSSPVKNRPIRRHHPSHRTRPPSASQKHTPARCSCRRRSLHHPSTTRPWPACSSSAPAASAQSTPGS